jgi:hypothetical protein
MPSHVITMKWAQGNLTLNKEVTLAADGENNRTATIPQGTTQEVAFAAVVANLVALYIVSSLALTLKTNSSEAPDEEIELEADQPLVWYEGCGADCPFQTDITALFATLAAGDTDATLEIRALLDTTP